MPSTAKNFRNIAAVLEEDGTLGEQTRREVTTEPIEGVTAYQQALVTMRRCISAGHRSHTTLTFDIPAGDPRSPSPVRINRSYIGFEATAMGRPTGVTIRVVLPAEFGFDHLDDHWTAQTNNGLTTYSLSPADQAEYPDPFIGARDDRELVGVPVDADNGQLFNVMHWPNDAKWGKFVAAQVERGVPALSKAVGVDWPIVGETQIREAYSNYFDGYAGWFDPENNYMEIGDSLDQVVIFHELSHAWFNDGWFRERWLREGFAETYASTVLRQLGVESAAPEHVSPQDDGAIALESWEEPHGNTDGTDDLEQYGYNASYYVVSQLVDEIGVAKMRDVLRMVDSGETI
ncbi:MAG TPA: hypothetical protein PLV13_04155, partial [Ilumatobacteraceae bacterium]|nr:hypothetical protein [Ilumatobacteraceae bacterium]